MQSMGQGIEQAPGGYQPIPPPVEKIWTDGEILELDQEEQMKDEIRYISASHKQIGMNINEKTGRNSIEENTCFTPIGIKQMEKYVIQREIEDDEEDAKLTEEEKKEKIEIDARASTLEVIAFVKFAKCLSETYRIYLSSRYGDRMGYDIVFKARKKGWVSFVVDTTLGKNDLNQPINPEKIKKVRKNIINGIMFVDDYTHNGNTYIPTASIMPPALIASLPDRTPNGKDNLNPLVNRTSLLTEQPSGKDFTDATYLTQQLLKSMGDDKKTAPNENTLNLWHIHQQNLFNVDEIEERTEKLHQMLTPTEQEKWPSIKDKVRMTIEQWPKQITTLRENLWTVEDDLAKKADCDADELWDRGYATIWDRGYVLQ